MTVHWIWMSAVSVSEIKMCLMDWAMVIATYTWAPPPSMCNGHSGMPALAVFVHLRVGLICAHTNGWVVRGLDHRVDHLWLDAANRRCLCRCVA